MRSPQSSAGKPARRAHSYAVLGGVAAAAAVLYTALPAGRGYTALALGVLAALVAVSLVEAPTPPRDGRYGPQWSIDGLRRLRGWHVVDDVPFDGGRVDHVVIAPSAVLAVETEYHARDCWPNRDLGAADRAAHRVRQFLDAQGMGGAVVVPMVLVCGPGAPAVEGGHQVVDGVHVVDGNNPGLWLHEFRELRSTVAAHLDLSRLFDRYVAGHRRRAAVPFVGAPSVDAAGA